MGHGARVVTAAALIMISVFGGFVFLEDPVIKSMGFALAVGVAIDAFVVRMTIVPAVMSLLGDRAWWLPRWLDRALPNVDIEGEGLRDHLEDRTPTHGLTHRDQWIVVSAVPRSGHWWHHNSMLRDRARSDARRVGLHLAGGRRHR